MSTLAANGNRVLFVENTGVRAPSIRDLPRIRPADPQLVARHQGVPARAREPVHLLAAPAAVSRIRRSSAASTGRCSSRALRRWMRAAGFGRPIVWTFLPTPLVARGDPDARSDCHRSTTASTTSRRARAAARRIVESEEQLFRDVDLVFVTSEKLRETRGAVQPAGPPVSVRRQLQQVRSASDWRPTRCRRISRRCSVPIVGYVGGIHRGSISTCWPAPPGGCPRRRLRWSARCRSTSGPRRRSAEPARLRQARARRRAAIHQGLRRRHRAVRAERLHRERVSDEAERVPRDGHSGRRDGPAGDSPVQRRARRRASRSLPIPSSSSRRCSSALRPATGGGARPPDRRRPGEQLGSRASREMSALIDDAVEAERSRRSRGKRRCCAPVSPCARPRGRCGGRGSRCLVFLAVFHVSCCG